MKQDPAPPELLSIDGLSVVFDTDEGALRAVDDVSFDVREGEVVGLVGESGCGKSVTAMSALRLVPSPPGRVTAGRILFRGRDLLALPIAELRGIRGREISTVFQDPMTSLSPLHRVGAQLAEALQLHRRVGSAEARTHAVAWLEKVGLPDAEQRLDNYPHQLSGGMRQRVMIAMALMLDPALVIADEPTTALDVTVQAQVFDVMMHARRAETSVLLITHDMGVVWERCRRVVVMYAGQVVEQGTVEEVFERPLHPYTAGLLAAIPSRQPRGGRLSTIPGQVPSPMAFPTGCRFHDRCPRAFDRCRSEAPPLYRPRAGCLARCFLHA